MTNIEYGQRGGCLCGAIRFKTSTRSARAVVCCCRTCQRMTGGPFSVQHFFCQEHVDIQSGLPTIYTHAAGGGSQEVQVYFCGSCGAHLFLKPHRSVKVIGVFTTTFDDPSAVQFDACTLQYDFVRSAQSGTIIPRGFRAFEARSDPESASPSAERIFSDHFLIDQRDGGTGPNTGGCICGAVRYEADSQPEAVVICHCRSCQRSLGSGVNFEILWEPDHFRLTKGKPVAYRYRGGSGKMVEKRFCGCCGSSLWLTGERFREVGVFRGSLDRPNRIEISPATAIQIYLDEALPCGMVIAHIEAFSEHRRAADGFINTGRFYHDHWRSGDKRG